jgi:hypothetical protein
MSQSKIVPLEKVGELIPDHGSGDRQFVERFGVPGRHIACDR